MRTCTRRGGCEQAIPSADALCYAHQKIRDGFITTTRAESDLAVVDIQLTPLMMPWMNPPRHG